ncbi:protein crumbs homolog 1 isoform X2 [Mixophyes fleayi]|uniref:protein crumbs homolog 1 isoform X2 n=1 Tax=Mixophyes fleayi TaxID=3061075 RepID=UPI003F4DE086
MMEQPRILWTCSLSLAVLMFLQLRCTICVRNTTHCSSPPCTEVLPCSSIIGCGSSFDPCLSNPCPRNATCQVTLNTETYECRCPAGFKGRNCEIPMKRCFRNLCRHGGECYITDRGPTCFCTVGYKGTFCEAPEDECLWNPCQNGAVCRDRGNGQACYCVPGFQGALCDIEVDECISYPCQHGGKCLNQIGRYTCVCLPEYTGTNCEMEFNECFSDPCLNGATCLDYLGSFSCICQVGFSGDLCEVNINECASSPCLNGGHCFDMINRYNCDCSMVGFTGLHCEAPAPLCLSQPCKNNATCLEGSGSFKCLCWPGYTGSLCEIDMHMCRSQPCMYGMECVELMSFNTSIGGRTEEQEQFTGYICKCGNGLTGVHCEKDINECKSNPCQNKGICENLVGSYTCQCSSDKDSTGRYYGGPDCIEVLIGCEEQTCHNGGSCIPFLMDGKHYHNCLCPSGFIGTDCETKTTFSFNGTTILPLRNISFHPQRGEFFNLSLSFRTAQISATIIHLGDQALSLRLYLQKGFLFLSFLRNSQLKTLLHLSRNVSDDLWHTVEITFADNILLKLLDPSCGITCVDQSHNDGPLNIVFQEIQLGGDLPAQTREWNNFNDVVRMQSWFVGCMQDIKVGSVVFSEEDGKLAGIEIGCKRQDHCESNPCGSRGKCINLWLSYYCDCYRPYKGNNCSKEYEAARFGHGNVTSYAIFQTGDKHSDDIIISAFVRTQHDSGLLFALGNATFYEVIVSLEDGKLTANTGKDIISKGEHRINDDHFHLVSLKLSQHKLELFTSSLDLISMDIKRGHYPTFLHVGGLEDPLETMKRGGYFRGCVQDLRIGDSALEFFPNSESITNGNTVLNNVTKGCKNNSLCKSSPCQHGGICHVRDNCTCPPNTAGKTCKDLKWCQFTQCPPGSVCQPVPGGYECISNALFSGKGHEITFRSNGKIMRDLTNLTIGFRTLDSESVLLHAQREPEIITVGIHRKLLHFHLQSGNDLSAVSLLSMESVSDSQWHTVTLSMTAPGSQSSTWQMEIDGKPEKIISSLATGNLNFLREGTDIHLGVDIDGIKRNFSGCLGTVLIEGIHLPYFADSDYLVVKPQIEQFVKTSPESVDIRCLVSDPCASHPCLYGGSCHDVFTHAVCTCPAWRTGAFCEKDIRECLPNPCVHGNCTVEPGGYKCECESGYTGTNCDISSCHGHLCANGGTCVMGTAGYLCICPANFTGQHCRFNRMPSTFCGDDKKNITCYNFSNCTNEQGILGCSCQPGFVGNRCEIDVDECESNPCLNGGLCQNLPNRFHCFCDLNYAGEFCEIDLSDLIPPGIFTAVASVVVALFFAVCAGLCIFIAVAGMRSSQGTYSPSRQEKEGSRVEMWNIAQPPPLERLI